MLKIPMLTERMIKRPGTGGELSGSAEWRRFGKWAIPGSFGIKRDFGHATNNTYEMK